MDGVMLDLAIVMTFARMGDWWQITPGIVVRT